MLARTLGARLAPRLGASRNLSTASLQHVKLDVTESGVVVQRGNFGSVWMRQLTPETPVAALLAKGAAAYPTTMSWKAEAHQPWLGRCPLRCSVGGLACLRLQARQGWSQHGSAVCVP